MRYFLILLFIWQACFSGLAATPAEMRSFNAAVKLFDTPLFTLAEADFARFVEQNPESTLKSEAILRQAQSRFYQTNFVGAVELLQKQFPQAGNFASEYVFWIGQAFFNDGKLRLAAAQFAELATKFPESPLRLEASYKQALAESKLEDWPRVIELLQTPSGIFEIASKAQPNHSFVVDGYLLLGEALLKQNRYAEAAKTGGELSARNLTPETKWCQNYLLCRVRIAEGQAEQALQSSTNLVAAAQEWGNRRAVAESVMLRGKIFESLNRFPEAIQVYEQNFAEGTSTNVPGDIRREAFFKTIELNLAQKELTNAIARLETFIERNPTDVALELAKITLGELQLKQYVAAISGSKTNPATASNLFDLAQTNFNFVITNSPQSQHLGKAFLNRGWCFWLLDKMPEAEADFASALKHLPLSGDRAVARFKLADAQFKQTNYAAAVTNYQVLIETHATNSAVTNALFEPALFQTVRASLQIGNDSTATNAMAKMLDWFPQGALGDQGLLLVGQKFNKAGKSSAARELFLDFLKRVPDSPRQAEIKLAIAQTYVEEKNWPTALLQFETWVTNFSAHPLLPQGEFARALLLTKAGQESNAFVLFTNFVARFPTNQHAALAQNWVADYFWNRGDFRNAEKSYQELYQKFSPPSDLAYQARLMAGRAAYDRTDYAEAATYFRKLIESLDKDTSAAATAVNAQALFALGDTLFQNFLSNTNNDLRDAIAAFARITEHFSTDTRVALAWGRLGDCYLQWAGIDAAQAENYYQRALQCYGTVFKKKDVSDLAKIAARSHAEVGIGKVCEKVAALKVGTEKRAWLDDALKYYGTVWTLGNLRDGETFDAKWVYEAGMAAARICETSDQWEQAKNIYLELAKLLPPLRPALEKRVEKIAKDHAERSDQSSPL